MAARGVHAAQHYLIIEDQLSNELRTSNLQRMVAGGNTRDHIRPVPGQRVKQVKFEGRNTTRVQDQIHRTNCFLDLIRGYHSPVQVTPSNVAQPLWASARGIDDIQAVNVGPSKL